MHMVNVLFLHAGRGTSDDWIRGSEKTLLTLLNRLDRGVVTPFLFCGNELLAAAARSYGVETMVTPMPQIMVEDGTVRFQFLRWLHVVRNTAALIKAKRIGVVYCNGASTHQVGHYAAKLSNVPAICHLHSPYNRRHLLLYRVPLACRTIFVSRAIREGITSKQTFSRRSEVIYNGVNTDAFRPSTEVDPQCRARLGIDKQAFVFGQVSSLIHRKGIDVLLQAFAVVNSKHPESRLVLVGGGGERSDYVSLAQRLGLSNCTVFTGDCADPVPFYQHVFDVNVLASRRDAFPLSLLEAGACGLPSIASNVDGIPEIVIPEETGLLFPSENSQALAEAMCTLLESRQMTGKLGRFAREMTMDRFPEANYIKSVQRAILEEAEFGA
jgi:glycosyltransferase involved in cell wall biosynthesis